MRPPKFYYNFAIILLQKRYKFTANLLQVILSGRSSDRTGSGIPFYIQQLKNIRLRHRISIAICINDANLDIRKNGSSRLRIHKNVIILRIHRNYPENLLNLCNLFIFGGVPTTLPFRKRRRRNAGKTGDIRIFESFSVAKMNIFSVCNHTRLSL